MRFFTARSVTLAALVPALLLFAVVPGCAKQSEGERCGDDIYGADSADCSDGLICKSVGGPGETRCCYADGRINDSRCEVSSASGTAGAANAGSGNAGTGGDGVAGGSTDVGGNGGTAGASSVTAGSSNEAGEGG